MPRSEPKARKERKAKAKAKEEVKEKSRGPRRWTAGLLCLAGSQAVVALFWWRPEEKALRTPPFRQVEAPAAPAQPEPVAEEVPGPDFTGEAPEEGDIAVLLIASGRSVANLRQTLQSLLRNFEENAVLVSQAAPGEASREASKSLNVAWAGPSPVADVATFDGEAEPWLHYGRSLEHASKHFGKTFRSLFVVEEDLIFSNGLRSFLSQLHPLLFEDKSLWCISAWNDYSLAPFARDVSSVLRSSWFSGRAFLVTFAKIQELLPHWSLQRSWKPLLRSLAQKSNQDCLLPEVSRATLVTYQCEGVGIRGQCDEEEVETRQRAPLAIFARKHSALGDVSRLTGERYPRLLGSQWQGGLAAAMAITSVEQLFDSDTPLLLVIDDAEDMKLWGPVLGYLGLSATPERGPRNMYQGVVRLRWRKSILYLASASAPLLRSKASVKAMDGRDFELLPGSGALRKSGAQPRAFLAPWSKASVAAMGSSCLLHCASLGEHCVDADLAAAAKCASPLTDLLACSSCVEKADSPVFPGLHSRSQSCYAAAAVPNLPGSKYSKCSAQQEDVQRLCVCRQSKVSLDLQSASAHFALREKDTQRLKAFASTKERRSRPNLKRFGDTLQAGAVVDSTVQPTDLTILVLLPDTAVEELLQRTLRSLTEAQGFSAIGAWLCHSGSKYFVAQAAESAGLQRIQVQIDQRIRQEADRRSALYKGALEGILKQGTGQAVVALWCGDVLAPDALWYFAQLAQVLLSDPSLLAVNGWNPQGLAPYAADPTVVLRTDWFSGCGWMVTQRTAQELLSEWHLGRAWEAFFREGKFRKGRQFLSPELSRVVPDAQWVLNEMDVTRGKSQVDPSLYLQNPLCRAPVVDLGDVGRLEEQRYKRLFFIDWPGEGLVKTKILGSLNSLLEGKVNSGGPFRLVFRNQDVDTDTTQNALAFFFNLWPELPLRTSYYGVTRLRWRDTVLYLVPTSSPLSSGTLREELLSPEEDATTESILPPMPSQVLNPLLLPLAQVRRPLLVPAASELIPAELPGASCDSVCAEMSLQCWQEDLAFINTCDSLAVMGCRRCDADRGPEQPAQELIGPKAGRCLYNSDLSQFPITCDASHSGTRRLCICRELLQLSSVSRTRARDQFQAPSTTKQAAAAEVQGTPPAFLEQLEPSTLAVLVIASGKGAALDRCLESLSQAYGYNKNMVFVSQDGEGNRARLTAQKYRVSWRQVETGAKFAGEKEASHFKLALQHAIDDPFRDKSALIILDEDVIVSYDFLIYFAQLQILLTWEDTFSVSAWNENAVGPYSADPQELLRVDSFRSGAWMISARLLRELLPQWPRNFWQKHIRKLHAGKQSIIPEVPRVQRQDQPGAVVVTTYRDLAYSDLGNLGRLTHESYVRHLSDQLSQAVLVEDLRDLAKKELPPLLRLHYQSGLDGGAWPFLARFFQLPEDGHPPMLQGVVRLLWGRGLLFLCASPMVLKVDLRLPEEALPPEAFQEATRPLLLAPNAELLAADRTGQSCSAFCSSRNAFCAASDLRFMNNCEAMRRVLLCERCERNMGSDQPAVASLRSSYAYGACLYNGDIVHHPITCEASHRETRRLCVCRKEGNFSRADVEPVAMAVADVSPSSVSQTATLTSSTALTSTPLVPSPKKSVNVSETNKSGRNVSNG